MSERTKKSLLLVVPPALISFACTMFFAWGKHVGYDEGTRTAWRTKPDPFHLL